ncbi:hypothetical protein HPB51_020618 [Rhipicephalus microplus]|uniref:Uncharacterized protein n=1 Tax=Rhipicephalus microplus TaxID=6941 RepID=A0A9J6DJF8_RHIMP|nr:hypothetical protein HPB51_020618 [Rhipicephalus microplus]
MPPTTDDDPCTRVDDSRDTVDAIQGTDKKGCAPAFRCIEMDHRKQEQRRSNSLQLRAAEIASLALLMLFRFLAVQGTVPLKLDRPLPQSRAVPLIQKYGYFEPATIPRGRLTLRQATQMLADVKMDPGTFTAEAVAVQYSLDVRDVREVLHYFSIFRVHSIHLAQRDLTSIDDVKSELLSSRQDSQEGQISDAQNDDTEKKKV